MSLHVGDSVAERGSSGGAGRAQLAMERLTHLATELTGTSSAVLVLNRDGVSRVLASVGRVGQLLSSRWSFEEALYGPTDRVIQDNPAWLATLRQQRLFQGVEVGFFVRMPVVVEADHTLSLLCWSAEPRKQGATLDTETLNDVLAAIAEEFATVAPLLTDPEAHVTLAINKTQLIERARTAATATCLLDRELVVVAANNRFAALLATTPEAVVGRRVSDLALTAIDAIVPLLQRALVEKISTPQLEVIIETDDGRRMIYAATASPVSPVDTTDYFLLASVTDVTALSGREVEIERRVRAAGPAHQGEPTSEFLLETLVTRPAIRTRNGMKYLTVRSWRASLRQYQIKALKALKKRPPPELVEQIASELTRSVSELLGAAAFRAVVPIPCGHSRTSECFSVVLARAVAASLTLPMVRAFADQDVQGVSHPKQNAARPPLVLVQPVGGPVLLIDDVATSGRHFEEAVGMLKPHASAVLAIAWIGGDAADDVPTARRRTKEPVEGDQCGAPQ